MTIYPRWMVQPSQRGRHGVPGLRLSNRPTASEMAFDKVVISIPGKVTSLLSDPPSPREVMDGFREKLTRRAHNSAGMWSVPGQGRVRFDTALLRPFGTILRANLRTTWADDTHDLMLTLTVNPTRTLIHAMTAVEEASFAGAWLESQTTSTFFASAPEASSATTLDGNDNAFADLTRVRERIGEDHARGFASILERKLREWAIDVAAPQSEGFEHRTGDGLLVGSDGVHRVALDWSHLFIRSAEIYCERRHGDAPQLMERITTAVLAAHADADWQRYEIDEIGGRIAGSTVIGIKPTGRIKQLYYAKARDRIRIETRYFLRVRDNLRDLHISASAPLRDLLIGLRDDATRRLRWDAFCAMAAEPPLPTVTDFAHLTGVIARCCAQARVDPEPVFAELVGAGGFTQSRNGGAFPLKLVKRLIEAGLVHNDSLTRRARPGQPRRHHLTEPSATVARMIRQLFTGLQGGAI